MREGAKQAHFFFFSITPLSSSRQRSPSSLASRQHLRRLPPSLSSLAHYMPSLPKLSLAPLQSAAASVSYASWKLARSTGKAAWIATTSFLVLVVQLIIEMDREQQLAEFEAQQLGALTGKA